MIFLPILILVSLTGTSIAGGGLLPAHPQNAGQGIVPAQSHIAGNAAAGINGRIPQKVKGGQNVLKKGFLYYLLLSAPAIEMVTSDPQFMANSNFDNQQQYGGGGRKGGAHSNTVKGKGPAAKLNKLPTDAWKCERVNTAEGEKPEYKCSVKVESENKFNLLAKIKEGEEFVNIATVDPKTHEIEIDPASSGIVMNSSNIEMEEDDGKGGWTEVKSKKTLREEKKAMKGKAEETKPLESAVREVSPKQVRKAMEMKAAEAKKLVEGSKLSPKQKAEVEAHRKQELAKRSEEIKQKYGHISARLPPGRKLLQDSSLPYQEHVLWNDENGKYSILTRVRHIMVKMPTAPGTPPSYNFSVSFEPYYQPKKIYSLPWVQVTAPTADKPASPPIEDPNGNYDIGAVPSPATNDPAGKLPMTYQDVCSQTQDHEFSVCTWVDLSTDKQHGHVCNGYYYEDDKTTAADQKSCIQVKACALSGNGCPIDVKP